LDNETTISDLRRKVEKFRDDREWLKFHTPKDLSMALSIESAELEELFLWNDDKSVGRMLQNRTKLQQVKDEVADIEIYLLSLSSVLHMDLSDAVYDKLTQNARKYPVEKSKGSSRKYNELPA